MKKILKNLNEVFPLPLILVLIIIAPFYLTIGCPIQFLTGISCMGCGMSRAAVALLHLDFPLAFEMHPMIFIMPVVALFVLFRKKIPKKISNIFFIVFTVLMAGTYIYRLVTGSDILSLNYENGYIYRTISNLFFK